MIPKNRFPIPDDVGVQSAVGRPRHAGARPFGMVLLTLDGRPAAQLRAPKARQIGQMIVAASVSGDMDTAVLEAFRQQPGERTGLLLQGLRAFIQKTAVADREDPENPFTARERELMAELRANERARFESYLTAYLTPARRVPAEALDAILADFRAAVDQVDTDTAGSIG